MIILNPEFHRNLWSKFSPFRLLAVPLLVGIVISIFMTQENWAEPVYSTATYIYMVIVFIWGNYEAAASIHGENKSNTWDFQRMSSIGPWELSMGKLFGATSYTWYFGLTILAVMAVAYAYLPFDSKILKGPPVPISATIIFLVLSGIMGHACAITCALQQAAYKKTNMIGPFLIGMIISNAIWTLSNNTAAFAMFQKTRDGVWITKMMQWHGWDMTTQIFIIGSLMSFFVWIILGMQRKMREELQFRNTPVAYVSFLVFTVLYATGLMHHSHAGFFDPFFLAQCLVAFLIATLFAYTGLIAEAPNFAKYKRFFLHLRKRSWFRAWEETPVWIASLAFIIPLYLIMNFNPSFYNEKFRGLNILSMATALLLFMARDGFILHLVLLGGHIKHSRFVLIFYYLMVYFLLPFLCMSLLKQTHQDNPGWMNILDFKAAKQQLAFLFYPVGTGSFMQSILPPLIQAGIAGYGLKYMFERWDKKGDIAPAPDRTAEMKPE